MKLIDKYLKIITTHLLLMFLIPLNALAVTWNSTTAGDWNIGGNWNQNSTPSLGFNAGNVANVKHNMAFSGTLQIGVNGTVNVKSGATLTITNDLYLDNTGRIVIENGGKVIVQGSVTGPSGNVGSASNLQVNTGGTIQVTGNINISRSSLIYNWNGNVCVSGNINIVGNTVVNVNGGNVSIGGTLSMSSNGRMQGNSGTVTYNSTNIFSCGFSYLTCSGTNKGNGGCGAPLPPAGGINLATCNVATGAGCGGSRRVIIID